MIGRLHQLSFRAMGTSCTISVTARESDRRRARRALLSAREEVDACERALSRFDSASDLCRLNREAGTWVEVDPRLVDALGLALRTRIATGGRFDPTILEALVAAGYDRSFERLEERAPRSAPGWQAAAEVEVEPGRARVERGAGVDLGGIGKGFAASRAILALREAWDGLPGAIIDLGGDVAVWGMPPDRGPWRIAVADPRRPGTTLGVLDLGEGGVATSGRNARRFGPAGTLHHLIDPATGAPAVNGPIAVTVVALDAAEAEGYATALSISTLAEAQAHLAARLDLAALFVPTSGAPTVIGRLPLDAAPGLAGVAR